MFSNLSKGSVLYVLDTKGDMTYFTAPIENISLPRAKNFNPTFGQIPEMVVDIVASIDGEKREFRQVPTNNTIADFGPDSIVIADNKDSLINYARNSRQTDQNAVDTYPMHKERLSKWDRILSKLDPVTANDNAVKELKGQVESMQNQIAEALALLKQRTTNPV